MILFPTYQKVILNKISNRNIAYVLLLLMVSASTWYGINQTEEQRKETKKLEIELEKVRKDLEQCKPSTSTDI